MYPLNQKSVPVNEADKALIAKSRPVELNDGVDYAGARCDYLPPEYITFLMTGWLLYSALQLDLGMMAPSAVSDELYKLYQ